MWTPVPPPPHNKNHVPYPINLPQIVVYWGFSILNLVFIHPSSHRGQMSRGMGRGNGYFTAGAHRTAHTGLADLVLLLKNCSPTFQLTPAQLSTIDIEPYSATSFAGDIQRLASGRSDPGMIAAVVERSRDTLGWLAERVKIPFVLSFNRQAYEVDGRMKFWGGMALSVEQGGKGLINAHQKALKEAGVHAWFEARAVEILTTYQPEDEGAGITPAEVCGIVVEIGGERKRLKTPSVVLAAGGFEASKDLRMEHLGDAWINARVSSLFGNSLAGTAFNGASGSGYTLQYGRWL